MKIFDQKLAIIGGTAVDTTVLPSEQNHSDAPEVTILPYPYPIQNRPIDLPNPIEPEGPLNPEEQKNCPVESIVALNLL